MIDPDRNFPQEIIEFISKHIEFCNQNRHHKAPANVSGIVDKFGCNLLLPGSALSVDDVLEKYPLFMFLLDTYFGRNSYISIETIEDYVNTIYRSGGADEQTTSEPES